MDEDEGGIALCPLNLGKGSDLEQKRHGYVRQCSYRPFKWAKEHQ